MKTLITSKHYSKTKFKMNWAVITKERVVMQKGFRTKAEAEHFRDNAYLGYYKDCHVKFLNW
jgi:hypothetical protein